MVSTRYYLGLAFLMHAGNAAAVAVSARASGWSFLGCYTDSMSARSLPFTASVPGGSGAMTIELCQSTCLAAGYVLAGVEYADECYCGNALQNGGAPAPGGTAGCNMACAGNSGESCGGGNRLDLYSYSSTPSTPSSGWTILGCYTDSVSARSLPYTASVPGGSGAMTIELCQSTCLAAGYVLAGVEYADECYCGNALQNGGAPAPGGNAGCNMLCAGNSAETCGGGNRLDLYSHSGSSSTTTTTSSSSPTGTGNPLPGWTFLGCYIDTVGARTLPNEEPISGGMTNEGCQYACLAAGYSYAGTEYAGECWCGNAVGNGGGPAPDGSTGCNMACSGNAAETCGGPNRLDVYYHPDSSTPTPPPTTYALKATYDYTNWYSEFTFFADGDPTHGYVDYLTESAAQNSGLINTNNNQVYMGVDYTTVNPSAGRASVRVTSNAVYTHGLFIADIAHMPGSICGTWPAWWTVGPNWPNNGEIDIIEGVSQLTTNSITLHTAAGCTINTSGSQSGSVLDYTDCNTANADDGCGVSTSNTQGYGNGFNAIGGGVYAMQWTSAAIKVFFFPRNGIPSDITSGAPNPSSWGTPVVFFNDGSGCNIDSFFQNHQIVFDTTFCGDWAGNVWSSGSCASLASSCQAYVGANPGAFQAAYWLVNSVKVYQ